MQTCEQTILSIVEKYRAKINYAELTLTVYMVEGQPDKIHYSSRAWRNDTGLDCSKTPMASGDNTDMITKQMFHALEQYPSPKDDKLRQIEALKAQIRKLES